ncbi:hypothetical protein BS17DRAFT_247318 [Gyrodon lividus]|nr:hypothetical protein BS17DRAFT_247318 [Gyrodon lividus]
MHSCVEVFTSELQQQSYRLRPNMHCPQLGCSVAYETVDSFAGIGMMGDQIIPQQYCAFKIFTDMNNADCAGGFLPGSYTHRPQLMQCHESRVPNGGHRTFLPLGRLTKRNRSITTGVIHPDL